MKLNELLDLLVAQDGIENADVRVEVTATVKKRNTGETTENFQEIRERVIGEEELESLIDDTDWNYHGTVDVVGDFHLRDKFTKNYTVEPST